MAEIKCPMDKPVCVSDCAWYTDGKCVVVVVCDKLTEIANAIGATSRKTKKKG